MSEVTVATPGAASPPTSPARRRRARPAPARLSADAPHLRDQVPALGAAGYRAVAPTSAATPRGCGRTRPRGWPRTASTGGADVLDLADAIGAAGQPSTWSATTGAATWRGRRAPPSRTAPLAHRPSRPHPGRVPPGLQGERRRSAAPLRHHRIFHDPTTGSPPARGRAAPARRTGRPRVGPPRVAEYVAVLGEPAAQEAALAGTARAEP